MREGKGKLPLSSHQIQRAGSHDRKALGGENRVVYVGPSIMDPKLWRQTHSIPRIMVKMQHAGAGTCTRVLYGPIGCSAGTRYRKVDARSVPLPIVSDPPESRVTASGCNRDQVALQVDSQ